MKKYLEPHADFDCAICEETETTVTYYYEQVLYVLMDQCQEDPYVDDLYEEAEDLFWNKVRPENESEFLKFVYPKK